MSNRDYFAKPRQSSRSADYYGNTGPLVGMNDEPSGAILWIVGANIVGGFVIACMFFAWIG